MTVISAVPLSQEELDETRQRLSRITGAQVEIGLDMVDVADDERDRDRRIAPFERIDDGVVLVVAAARCAGAAIERDDERGAGDQLLHEALQDGIAAHGGV